MYFIQKRKLINHLMIIEFFSNIIISLRNSKKLFENNTTNTCIKGRTFRYALVKSVSKPKHNFFQFYSILHTVVDNEKHYIFIYIKN